MVSDASDRDRVNDAGQPAVRLRVMGMVDVSMDGEPVAALLKRRKPMALFAYLALAKSEKFFQRDHLCDVFWPESTQERARASLRQAIAAIRRALPDVIELLGVDALRARPGSVRSDVTDFLAAVERADWVAAADFHTGELFEGFHVSGARRFEEWLDGLRAQVNDARRRVPVDDVTPSREALTASTETSDLFEVSVDSGQPRRTPPRNRSVPSGPKGAFAASVAAILLLLVWWNPTAPERADAARQPLVVVQPFESDNEPESAAALGVYARDIVALEVRRRLAGVTVAAVGHEDDIRRSDAVYVSGVLRDGASPAQLEVRLTDVDGTVVRLLEPVVLDPAAPREALAGVAEDISVLAADRLLFSGPPFRKTRLEDTHVPPWGAYLAFARSLGHSARNRWSLALPEVERAVELAPDWTEARLEWATQLANNGQPARADSVVTSVLEVHEHMGPFQRARADWIVAALNNDREARLRAQRGRLALEGRPASIQLVYEFLGLGRPAEALAAAALLDRDEMIRREVFRYWAFQAEAHHALGDFQAELSVTRDGLELFPDDPSLIRRHAVALAATGQAENALAWIERAALAFNPHQIALAVGDELAFHGWRDQAARAYARGYALGREPERRDERAAEVLLLLRLERWEAAGSRLEPLLDHSRERARDFGSMGVIAARLGREAEAREWMARLEPSEFHGVQRPEALLSRARIAAALGEHDVALQSLVSASASGLAWARGSHDPVFEELWAHDAFITWAAPRALPDRR